MSKVLLLLLVLIAAAPAAAEDFREAVPIGLGGGAKASKAVDAVIAPDGAQTVAFMRGGFLWAVRRGDPDGAQRLGRASGSAGGYGPGVVLVAGADGTRAIVWSDARRKRVVMAAAPPHRPFESAHGDRAEAYALQAAVATDGTVAVAWADGVAVRPAGGGWQAPDGLELGDLTAWPDQAGMVAATDTGITFLPPGATRFEATQPTSSFQRLFALPGGRVLLWLGGRRVRYREADGALTPPEPLAEGDSIYERAAREAAAGPLRHPVATPPGDEYYSADGATWPDGTQVVLQDVTYTLGLTDNPALIFAGAHARRAPYGAPYLRGETLLYGLGGIWAPGPSPGTLTLFAVAGGVLYALDRSAPDRARPTIIVNGPGIYGAQHAHTAGVLIGVTEDAVITVRAYAVIHGHARRLAVRHTGGLHLLWPFDSTWFDVVLPTGPSGCLVRRPTVWVRIRAVDSVGRERRFETTRSVRCLEHRDG